MFDRVKPSGIFSRLEHQHFNLDGEKTAKLIVAEPNISQAFGVDVGAGFDVLEPSPDYKP
jgi:hypothetical protein